MKYINFILIVSLMISLSLSGKSTISPRLRFLLNASSRRTSAFFEFPDFEQIPVTVTFSHPVDNSYLNAIEQAGFIAELYRNKPFGISPVLVGFLKKSALNTEILQAVPR